MADSAMMSDAIPTLPRSGKVQVAGASKGGIEIVSTAAADPIPLSLLVTAIRVLGMLQIPQRTATGDCRNRSEVVCRRWRAHGPLERPGVPRVVAGPRAFPVGDDQVRHEDQQADGLDECTDRNDQVER